MHADGRADLAFVNGRIATMATDRRTVEAVAVVDGRIKAVGSDTDVRGLIGPRTRVIDLRGRTLVPGFGDAHIHPVTAGLERMQCDLRGATGPEALVALVAAYAAAHPDLPWIHGGGWSVTDFPQGIPRRDDLDRAVPDRPVYLDNRDGHGAWVNSRALDLAGIDASTADPADGRIERDPDGRPSGTLQEGARFLVSRLLPPPTLDDKVTGLLLAQTELHRFGITNWQDAHVEPDIDVAYTTVAGRGELTARVVAALGWDDARGTEQIGELVERREATAAPRYAPTSVKFFLDGILENHTGSLIEPYLDADGRPTENLGLQLFDPAALARYVTALDSLGFQPHFHAIGDRAVRDALDSVAVARSANGPSGSRPHIAHIQLVHPDDRPRFRALGVAANAQAYWAALEDQLEHLTIPFIGPERTTWTYPFGSLLRAGATLVMGSDWSVSTPDPLLQMEVAVDRVNDEHRGRREPFLPDERIGLMDALAGFTVGSAWVNHLDADVGTIEVGKAADLVVLDRDLFDRGAGAIGETRVVATFMDGVAVFEVPDLGG